MYAYCHEHFSDERGANDTDEQFVYKTRKKLWGPFKQQVWTLPEATRAAIRGQLEAKLDFLFNELRVPDTEALVRRWVSDPPRIARPQPESLKAVATA
jgi:hypothetical protein